MKGSSILTRDHGVGFPMAELSTLIDEIRSLVNADAARNGEGMRTARKGSFASPRMSASKIWNQRAIVAINKAIDRFMRKGKLWIIQRQPA